MGLLIKANGIHLPLRPKNECEGFDLAELRAAIGGGWIEHLALPRGRHVIIDEEGKLKGLPWNSAATAMAQELGYVFLTGDVLVGDVLFCAPRELR